MHLTQTIDTERYIPYDFETLTVSSTALGPTQSKVVAGDRVAYYAHITVEDAQVRYRLDGGDPTVSSGHSLYANDTLEVIGAALQRLKFIRATGNDAVVHLTYFLRKQA